MAEFTDQKTKYDALLAAVLPNIEDMEQWRSVWERMTMEQKKAYLNGPTETPLDVAAGLYIYLKPFFEDINGLQLDMQTFKVEVV